MILLCLEGRRVDRDEARTEVEGVGEVSGGGEELEMRWRKKEKTIDIWAWILFVEYV